jgi:FkbM family methyltransferase
MSSAAKKNQKILTMLGLMARTVRSMGCGVFLSITRDLVDSIFLKCFKSKKLPLKAYVDGYVMYGCLRHRSFLYGLSTGHYESFMAELFKKHVRYGMTVVDCGAHIGLYTLLAAQLVGTKGSVFAFEPDYYNFPCLVSNIYRNKYQNVTAFQKAISNRVGNVTLYQSSGTISTSLGNRKEMKNAFKGLSLKRVLVQSTTLDSELSNLPIDVVKFDIEGAETLALQGMSRMIKDNQSLILFMEINPSALLTLGNTSENLVGMLKDLNFDVYFIDELNRKLIPINEKSVFQKGMLYCKKSVIT